MNSQFEVKVNEVFALHWNGMTQKAFTVLDEISRTAHTQIEKRRCGHYWAQLLMQSGQANEAAILLKKTLLESGSHVLAQIDLAACYLLAGQFHNWATTVNDAELEFKKAEPYLSPSTKFKFLLQLAKFKEELGSLHESLFLYETLRESFNRQIENSPKPRQLARLNAQILRLQCQYFSEFTVNSLYQSLLLCSAEDGDWDCVFEIEHSLMLAEFKIFGAESRQAIGRLKGLLENPLANSFDKGLVLVDLFYECLINGISVPSEFIKITQTALEKNLKGSEDLFGSIVFAVANSERAKFEISLDLIFNWSKNMTPASFIRILALVNHYFIKNEQAADRSVQEYVRHQLAFLLGAYDVKLRSTWVRYLKINDIIPTVNLTYDPKTNFLINGSRKLNLSKKKSYQEIIKCFLQEADCRKISIYDLHRNLWNSDGSASEQARLRMRVHRLNQLIFENLGIHGWLQFQGASLWTKTPILSSPLQE